MKISLTSVFVDDQEKALAFYTDVLGFVKKTDMPAGDYKWLTVASPDGPDDIELLLEPNAHPAARAYQQAIYGDGIPATSFAVDNVQAEFERLRDAGVAFRMEPTETGAGTIAMFDDTCGNFIQIYQV